MRILFGDLAVIAKIDGRSDTSKLPDSLIVVECDSREVSAIAGDGTAMVDYAAEVPAEYARLFLRIPGPLYVDDLPLHHGVATSDERKAIVASLRDRDRRLFEAGKALGTQIAGANDNDPK